MSANKNVDDLSEHSSNDGGIDFEELDVSEGLNSNNDIEKK